jgi:hypothetical protein
MLRDPLFDAVEWLHIFRYAFLTPRRNEG